MNERDRGIIESLKKFRVLDRDQIIKLHFTNVKAPIDSCNKVLKRLNRDGHIEVDLSSRPYNYFPSPCSMRKDSMKIPHFKEIANFYISLLPFKVPTQFEVEFKTGQKGSIEPDIYMVWNGAPYFVEIQRNFYSSKVMEAKKQRYVDYFESRDWKVWTQHFPFIWILSEHKYNIDFSPLRLYQTKTSEEFVNTYLKRPPKEPPQEPPTKGGPGGLVWKL
ncbi:MAG: hypothetical protein ACQET8_23185 [Bacillota bacterium]